MGYDPTAQGVQGNGLHMIGGIASLQEVLPLRTLQAVQTPRLHERLVEQLVQHIVGGGVAPGEALPTEPDLAQRFGVSRTVVREAVRVLAAKGLVAVRQGSGMWVQPSDRWDHLDPLVIFERIRSGGDEKLLDELIETRRVLETEIASLAAVRRTADDLAGLDKALAGMSANQFDAEAYTRQDLVFHDAVLAAARNRLLCEALRPVQSALQAGRFIAVRRASVIARSLPSHRQIFEAIDAGDPTLAREAMLRHIVQFEEDIRAGLRAGASG
jgi:DNA-binding FadR family transcriptional regulator